MTIRQTEYLRNLMEFHGLILLHDSFLNCEFRNGRFTDYVALFCGKRRFFLDDVDDLAHFELEFMLKLFEHRWVDFKRLSALYGTPSYLPEANNGWGRFLRSLATSYRFAAWNSTLEKQLRKRLWQNNALLAVGQSTYGCGRMAVANAVVTFWILSLLAVFIWYGVRLFA